MTNVKDKVAAIKALLENENDGKYVTYYETIADYNQERGLETEEEGFEDIVKNQERGDELTLADLQNGFLIIDESGSSQFDVYKKATVETEKATFFE